MITYRILNADGTSEVREQETPMTLEEQQAVVGGWITMVPMPLAFGIFTDGYVYANEEGNLQNLPRNIHGTVLPSGDFLRGNLLVIEGDDDTDTDNEV